MRAVPLTVADTVFAPATVEESVPVATPLPFVPAVGCVSVFPVPVAASTTDAPLIGFPEPSLAVTVIVVDPAPAVIVAGAAATVDSVAETVADVTVSVPLWLTAVPLTVADTVFVAATVEESAPVAMPLASVVAVGCVSVLPLPVAASTTAAPCNGLPFASRAVTVTVADPPTDTLAGDTASVDSPADTTDVPLG